MATRYFGRGRGYRMELCFDKYRKQVYYQEQVYYQNPTLKGLLMNHILDTRLVHCMPMHRKGSGAFGSVIQNEKANDVMPFQPGGLMRQIPKFEPCDFTQ